MIKLNCAIAHEESREHYVVYADRSDKHINAVKIIPHDEGSGASFIDKNDKLVSIVGMDLVREIHIE